MGTYYRISPVIKDSFYQADSFCSGIDSVTTTRSRIEVSIPRKHGPAIAGYESVCVRAWIFA